MSTPGLGGASEQQAGSVEYGADLEAAIKKGFIVDGPAPPSAAKQARIAADPMHVTWACTHGHERNVHMDRAWR